MQARPQGADHAAGTPGATAQRGPMTPPAPLSGGNAASDDYRLARSPDVPAARAAGTVQPPVVGEPPDFDHPPIEAGDRMISLAHALGMMTVASLVFAVGVRIPPRPFAGLLGLLAMISLMLSGWWKRPPLVAQVAWWLLLAVYLLASARAMLTG